MYRCPLPRWVIRRPGTSNPGTPRPQPNATTKRRSQRLAPQMPPCRPLPISTRPAHEGWSTYASLMKEGAVMLPFLQWAFRLRRPGRNQVIAQLGTKKFVPRVRESPPTDPDSPGGPDGSWAPRFHADGGRRVLERRTQPPGDDDAGPRALSAMAGGPDGRARAVALAQSARSAGEFGSCLPLVHKRRRSKPIVAYVRAERQEGMAAARRSAWCGAAVPQGRQPFGPLHRVRASRQQLRRASCRRAEQARGVRSGRAAPQLDQ